MRKLLKGFLGLVYFHLVKKNWGLVGNRILIYHAFGSKLEHDTYGISISPHRFVSHLKYIRGHFPVIPIAFDSNFPEMKQNTISISIDDGYEDNLIAVEALCHFNFPFSLFITTDFIGRDKYLSKKQILEISQIPFCSLGTHGKTHRRLGTLSPAEQEMELRESKSILEDIVGVEINQMSLPHGSNNIITREIAQKVGYRLICSSKCGLNTKANLDWFSLCRTEIIKRDSIGLFRRKLHGYYDFQ